MRSRGMKNVLFAILLTSAAAFAADPDSAGLESLRQAAVQGSVDAQYELGILYEFGYDFTDHKAAAYAWYDRAAEQGSAPAARRRDALKAQLSAAEIGRAASLIPPPPATSTATGSASETAR